MIHFLILASLLCLANAIAASKDTCAYSINSDEVKTVCEWKWTSQEPQYLAVHDKTIYVSVKRGQASSLVCLRNITEPSPSPSPPPNFTPFQRKQTEKNECLFIADARGLEVDTLGRLWVVDNGNKNCQAKLWIFDLNKNDETVLVHQFPNDVSRDRRELGELVLDQTHNNCFAYITDLNRDHLIVFDLNANRSWTMQIMWKKIRALALNTKEEIRKLYISHLTTKELYSLSAAEIRTGNINGIFKRVGSWRNTRCSRMLFDSHGVMYASFIERDYISMWQARETQGTIREQCFFQGSNSTDQKPPLFALDSSGYMWLIIFRNGKHSLLKIYVGSPSYLYKDKKASGEKITETSTKTNIPRTKITPELFPSGSKASCNTSTKNTCHTTPPPGPTHNQNSGTTNYPNAKEETKEDRQCRFVLIGSTALILILGGTVIIWLIVLLRRAEKRAIQSEAAASGDVMLAPTAEPLYEEVKNDREPMPTPLVYDYVTNKPLPPPSLYETPIPLTPGTKIHEVGREASDSHVWEELGPPPPPPAEYDDVGPPEPENIYDQVHEPGPSKGAGRKKTQHPDSAQYLRVLPNSNESKF